MLSRIHVNRLSKAPPLSLTASINGAHFKISLGLTVRENSVSPVSPIPFRLLLVVIVFTEINEYFKLKTKSGFIVKYRSITALKQGKGCPTSVKIEVLVLVIPPALLIGLKENFKRGNRNFSNHL